MKNILPKNFKPMPWPYYGYCDKLHSSPQLAVAIKRGKNLYVSLKLCQRHLNELTKG